VRGRKQKCQRPTEIQQIIGLKKQSLRQYETKQKEIAMKRPSIVAMAAFPFLALANFAFAQDWQSERFRVSSTTFENGATMPLSTINNIEVDGVNGCSINGAPGGDESPELSWANAPRRTRSFAVIAFDVTAGYIHWGMYNISPTRTELPENAGVTGSKYGKQVINNFGSAGTNADLNYGGPCPPSDYPPNVHHYVFTVYALDIDLTLPGSANFPPTGATLFRALVEAGTCHHILASASITGLYSTTSPSE
jgi:Raf kinase inhibitor-like YbhB/YbcL family protein